MKQFLKYFTKSVYMVAYMVLETKGLSIVAKAERRVAMLPCTVITVGV